jgi:UDP-galactopyranose mutase
VNKFDFLVVGLGLFGSTFARIAAERGKTCYIIDKRNHIGGNCYSEKIENINVHKYGPHIFHTNDLRIWSFINRFSEFINYQHVVKVNFKNKIYSFPINLMTLYQVYGVKTPEEAKNKLNQIRVENKNSDNLENWALSQIGTELYEIFIKGYTKKQWNKDPKDLPSSIIKRIPIRTDYNDRYFNDKYQGVPKNGYTEIFNKMLDHPNIKFETNVDYFYNKNELSSIAQKIIYTGKIDEFYEYKFGPLEYRSLRFEQEVHENDYQGCSIINFTDENVPHTRIIEHKHFEMNNSNKTVITKEFPDNYDFNKIPYYPINDEKNNLLYLKYKQIETDGKIIFGGRLGKYEYKDMHQIIASAITCAEKTI